MTTSISSFTVTVGFKGIVYDVEITPTLNGKAISHLPDRINQWNEVEKTHKIFSQKIEQMLKEAVPSDYSLNTHGLLTLGSAEGFTFADTSKAVHKTADLWECFVDCLLNPASYTAGVDPIGGQAMPEVGPNARLQFRPNAYLSLDADEQKRVRFSLFEKKVRQCFKLPFKDYEPRELACLAYLLPCSPDQAEMTLEKETIALWLSQQIEARERDELSLVVSRIQKELSTQQTDQTDTLL